MLRASFSSLVAACPTQCEVCRRWGRGRLCAACVDRFTEVPSRCACCGMRMAAGTPRCGACLREAPAFESTACVADYVFPWDRLITAFKFRAQVELAGMLAQRMTVAVKASSAPRPDIVLPVPLHDTRLVERGFNQSWELARRTARTLGLRSSPHVLHRAIPGPRQVESNRAQRLVNLRAAFMVEPRRRAEIAGLRVALVDDVMTTGATVHAAAEALRRGGATAVDVWVVARTPD